MASNTFHMTVLLSLKGINSSIHYSHLQLSFDLSMLGMETLNAEMHLEIQNMHN